MKNRSSLFHKGSRECPTWTPAAPAEVQGPPTSSVAQVPYHYLWCPREYRMTPVCRQLYHATLCFISHRGKIGHEAQTSGCGWNGSMTEQTLDCTKEKAATKRDMSSDQRTSIPSESYFSSYQWWENWNNHFFPTARWTQWANKIINGKKKWSCMDNAEWEILPPPWREEMHIGALPQELSQVSLCIQQVDKLTPLLIISPQINQSSTGTAFTEQ